MGKWKTIFAQIGFEAFWDFGDKYIFFVEDIMIYVKKKDLDEVKSQLKCFRLMYNETENLIKFHGVRKDNDNLEDIVLKVVIE